jgi:outer membrane protein OmpA-like peptidoglycan-associated protein
MGTPARVSLVPLVFLLCFGPRCFAGDLPAWTGGLFLDLEGQYYIVPDLAASLDPGMAERYGVSGGLIKPYPGFRAGLGYEWNKFRFSLESGYTWIEGDNPLVLDLNLVPLAFKAGYVFSPFGRLGIVPLLGAGLVFSSVNHYETAIDMLMENPARSTAPGFLASAGLRLGWSFVPALTVYAGAGLDCVIETGGLIPLPSLELGVNIKPFLFGRKPRTEPQKQAKTEAKPEPVKIVPVETPPLELAGEPAELPAEIPPPEPEAPPPEPEVPVRIRKTVYFPADAEIPLRAHLMELDEAGELLRSSPALGVTLRGYTAPYSTPGARRRLSEVRAAFCGEYLMREYGIEAGRITIEGRGAESLPETSDGSDWMRRCVEIIIENITRQGGES